MSAFYGQVEGCAQTIASRRGGRNSGIRSSAQSWDGSVITRMYERDGKTEVNIEIAEGSSFCGDNYFTGTIEELKEILSKGRR